MLPLDNDLIAYFLGGNRKIYRPKEEKQGIYAEVCYDGVTSDAIQDVIKYSYDARLKREVFTFFPMSCNLTFLPPEPIALIDEDDESETTTDERDACNISVASMSTYGISNRRRSNSAINSNYNFLKAQVSDCTLMGGHNGGKFAVWKITIVLQPVSRDKRAAAATPQIHIYKRYSQFVTFREELLEELHEIKEEAVRVQDRERTSKLMAIKVPPLPPPVPWYSYWQYQDVNMSKKWLMERRRGLEYFMNYVILNRCIVENCKKVILSFIERKDG